jgi:adenylate cyclase class IV
MKHQERKYRVESFEIILQKLKAAGATKIKSSRSTHYYAPMPNDDVLKLVDHNNYVEMQQLEENDGIFTVSDKIRLGSLKEGLNQLKARGFSSLNVVDMTHTDYQYKSGVVGLYTIDGAFYSIILDFPAVAHEMIANELGLSKAEMIKVPYDKLLKAKGKLRSTNIN